MGRSGSDGTGYLEISTQVKTSTAIDSNTTPRFSDASEAATTTGTSAELSTTPPSPTETTCHLSNEITNTTASSNSSCSKSSFIFTTGNQSTDYVIYNGIFPALFNFSICAWLSPKSPKKYVNGSLLSYCKGDAYLCKSLNIYFHSTNKKLNISIYTHDTDKIVGIMWKDIDAIATRTHFCVTASAKMDFVRLFINGKSGAKPEKISKNWKVNIPLGGLLIVGHEQDPPKDRTKPYLKEAHQAFVGKTEDLKLWDRILNETEIQKMNQLNCSCPDDAIVTLNQTNTEVKGCVISSYGGTCD